MPLRASLSNDRLVVLVVLLLAAACTGAPAQPTPPAPDPTATLAPTPTRPAATARSEPSPTPTSAPTEAPTEALVSGRFVAGTRYLAADFPPAFSVVADQSWLALVGPAPIIRLSGTDARVIVANPPELFLRGPIEACRDGPDDIGDVVAIASPATTAEWLAAFAQIAALAVRESEPTELGGAGGVQIDVAVEDVPGSSSVAGDRGTTMLKVGGVHYGLPRGESRILLLDTGQGVVWLSISSASGDLELALAEAAPLLASLEFE